MAGMKDLFSSPFTRACAALILVFLIGIAFNADGAFFRWDTHRDMLRHISVFAVIACGMTLVIITAGIDLSVGSVLGFTAVLFSILTLQKAWSPWLAIPVCLLAGLLCGVTSGGLVSRFKIQPFIATLAMMVFARGLAKWISGGKKISTAVLQPDGIYKYT
jgi:ribose transport system permease protein